MSSLTETADVSKKVILGLLGVVVALIVGRVLLNVSVSVWKNLNPPEPAGPTLGFGALPRLEFPNSRAGELTYRLETIGSAIPSFGDEGGNAVVYPIVFERSGFLDLDRAKSQAASLGFVFEPELIAGTEYRWTKSEPLPAILNLDSVANTFTLDVAWETDPGFFNNTATPTQQQAVSEARSYLKRAQFLPKDLDEGRSRAVFLQYSGGRFVETLSLSEADFVQVDLFRRYVQEDFRVWPTDPFHGLARVIVSSSRGQGERIVSAEYEHTQVNYEQPETYPIITGPEAWQLLNNGKAFVASAPENGDEAVVRRVSLGYYDSLDDQPFMQPVYVFEGDDDFVAYVPAIRPEYFRQTGE